jgi:hypothetical protein
MCSGAVALAISKAIGMYLLLIVVTWFSVNITFPISHKIYASRLLVICVAFSGMPAGNLCICTFQNKLCQ